MLRYHRQRREQRQRVERGDRRAPFQRRHRHVEDGEVVGHEPRVEPARLQLLDKADQVVEIEVRVRISARIAPPAGMDAHRAHERAQSHLLVYRHVVLRWPRRESYTIKYTLARIAGEGPFAKRTG